MSVHTMRRGVAAVSTALAVLSATAGASGQQVFYVDDDAPPGQSGDSWEEAIWDLQVALAKANAWPSRATQGVIINVAQGEYWPDPTGEYPEQSFRLLSGVTLIGGFRGLAGGGVPTDRDPATLVTTLRNLPSTAAPTVSSGQTYCIVRMLAANPAATLDGFTVTGADGEGGILVRGQARVLNCRVSGNRSWDAAGGVSAIGDWLELRNCEILDNRGTAWGLGGGVFAWVGALRMNSCVVRGNSGSQGAGVYAAASRGHVESCEISGNTTYEAPDPGWGNTAVHFSSSGWGWGNAAGIFPEVPPGMRVTNCTIAGNIGNFVGEYTGIEFRNCAVSLDSQPPSYFYLEGTFVDCVVDRSPPSPNYVLVRTLIGEPGFASPVGPDGARNTGDEDYRLAAGSPCIDAGRDEWLISGGPDAAGAPRIAGARVDIGAYEYGSFVCAGDFNGSGSVTPQDIYEFLAAFTLALPRADFNLDSRVTPQDVYDFLTAWYYGCD